MTRNIGTADPALRGIVDAMRAEIELLREERDNLEGDATELKTTGPVTAKLGQVVLVDPSAGAINVILQKCDQSDMGKVLTIKNYSNSANNIVLIPGDPDQLIDNQASVTMSAGYAVQRLTCIGSKGYIVVS